MEICVLISCMHEKDYSIIERSNVQTDAVVVNQCDYNSIEEFDFRNKMGVNCHVRFINTTERGLSRSRNLALDNSSGDICIFCDDDEIFVDNYPYLVVNEFEKNLHYGIIAFKLIYNRKTFEDKEFDYNRFSVTRVSSAQVAFRRQNILDSNIRFDTMLGSGSGNGGGEENKFLYQLLCKGEKAKYVPLLLAEVKENSQSLWFNGYTDQYIKNEGWGYKRIFGPFIAYPLVWYHAIKHSKTYKVRFTKFIYLLHKGFFENRSNN